MNYPKKRKEKRNKKYEGSKRKPGRGGLHKDHLLMVSWNKALVLEPIYTDKRPNRHPTTYTVRVLQLIFPGCRITVKYC